MEKRYLFRILNENEEAIKEYDSIFNANYFSQDEALKIYKDILKSLDIRKYRIIMQEVTLEQIESIKNGVKP